MKLSSTLVALLAVMMIFITGCNEPSPQQIVDGINKAGPTIIQDILIMQPAQDTAKKDAVFLSIAIRTDILPFIQNSKLPASQLIPQIKKLLGAKITNNHYVAGASAILSIAMMNVDIKAPTMTANEISYIVAACNAIADGCDAFVSGKIVRFEFYDVHKAHETALKKEAKNADKAIATGLRDTDRILVAGSVDACGRHKVSAESGSWPEGTGCIAIGGPPGSDCNAETAHTGSIVVGKRGQCIFADPVFDDSWKDVRR